LKRDYAIVSMEVLNADKQWTKVSCKAQRDPNDNLTISIMGGDISKAYVIDSKKRTVRITYV